MQSSIWLLAYLCSRERQMCLTSFLAAVSVLRSGVRLFSPDFHQHCPQLGTLKIKYTDRELRSFMKELCQSVDRGHLLLYPGHDFYPRSYLTLEEVPYLLRLNGAPVWMGLPGLAVVGSREPSELSRRWMDRHLSDFLQSETCFVASGGARGVDQKAHGLALMENRPTVVLLPSGLSCLYPHTLLGIENEVLSQGGAFLSEYEDGCRMQKHHFVQRNRLISGLASATLIIEAKLKSGTLITAQEAVEQHRPVWVLPGHPMDPSMQGSLNLLSQGATIVQDAMDLIMLFRSEVHGLTDVHVDLGKHLVGNSSSIH